MRTAPAIVRGGNRCVAGLGGIPNLTSRRLASEIVPVAPSPGPAPQAWAWARLCPATPCRRLTSPRIGSALFVVSSFRSIPRLLQFYYYCYYCFTPRPPPWRPRWGGAPWRSHLRRGGAGRCEWGWLLPAAGCRGGARRGVASTSVRRPSACRQHGPHSAGMGPPISPSIERRVLSLPSRRLGRRPGASSPEEPEVGVTSQIPTSRAPNSIVCRYAAEAYERVGSGYPQAGAGQPPSRRGPGYRLLTRRPGRPTPSGSSDT